MIDLQFVVGTVAFVGLAIDQGQIGNTLLENIVVVQLHYRKIIRSDAVHVHPSGAKYIFRNPHHIRAIAIGQRIDYRVKRSRRDLLQIALAQHIRKFALIRQRIEQAEHDQLNRPGIVRRCIVW